MKTNIKYSILLTLYIAFAQIANANDAYEHASKISLPGVTFEILVVVLILYLFFKGVKSCFKATMKNYTDVSYHNSRFYNIHSKENQAFDYQTAKRVKNLMETKHRNEFLKNSTINEHIKKEEKISI